MWRSGCSDAPSPNRDFCAARSQSAAPSSAALALPPHCAAGGRELWRAELLSALLMDWLRPEFTSTGAATVPIRVHHRGKFQIASLSLAALFLHPSTRTRHATLPRGHFCAGCSASNWHLCCREAASPAQERHCAQTVGQRSAAVGRRCGRLCLSCGGCVCGRSLACAACVRVAVDRLLAPGERRRAVAQRS